MTAQSRIAKAVAAVRRTPIILNIEEERERQDEKWGWPNGGLAGQDPYKKLAILAEEFGEVANALLEEDYENMKVELVQVAAVCVAWLESCSERGV